MILLVLLLAFAGCAKESNPVVIPPPPVMTGNWDYTAGAVTGIASLTEDNSIINGTLTFSTFNLPVSGTVTKSLQVTLGYVDASGSLNIVAVTNSSKTSMSGTLTITTTDGSSPFSFSATKR